MPRVLNEIMAKYANLPASEEPAIAQTARRVSGSGSALSGGAGRHLSAPIHRAGRRSARSLRRLWHDPDRRRGDGPRALRRRVRCAPGGLYPLAAAAGGQCRPRRLAPAAALRYPTLRLLDHFAAVYGPERTRESAPDLH